MIYLSFVPSAALRLPQLLSFSKGRSLTHVAQGKLLALANVGITCYRETILLSSMFELRSVSSSAAICNLRLPLLSDEDQALEPY